MSERDSGERECVLTLQVASVARCLGCSEAERPLRISSARQRERGREGERAKERACARESARNRTSERTCFQESIKIISSSKSRLPEIVCVGVRQRGGEKQRRTTCMYACLCVCVCACVTVCACLCVSELFPKRDLKAG